ncbi:NEDD4 family-interacting protein 2 isoform X1 [Amblyraja radiata]|uniref:NEDD4 family-interacting protein 2 isoform X1 n=1 Tax=Amblyraja radiata TaxID=386614 RepID=UPI0014021026|nr:NEDD4 family-interacting protein 2 isoform X1 [Amblyraja radiata]XP_032878829.1 NEDD4 family-interacting protein 2 isoform X1 [Amblyraja radiata]
MMQHHQACSRYQALHNEDDSSQSPEAIQPDVPMAPSETLPSETEVPPPPYSSVTMGATASATETDYQSELMPVPPPYSVATSLPTYDEAEKAKAAAMAAGAGEVGQRFREPRNLFDEILQGTSQEEDFPPRDDFNDADQLRVGNDGIFMLAFFMAFLFNWIGFCLSFCLTNTIAGRYGAICGFGLSLIKWILIVRFSDYFNGYFNGQYWLWWIFLVLGLLLFFRGFINYLKIRNMSENMAVAHRTRLFFIY